MEGDNLNSSANKAETDLAFLKKVLTQENNLQKVIKNTYIVGYALKIKFRH